MEKNVQKWKANVAKGKVKTARLYVERTSVTIFKYIIEETDGSITYKKLESDEEKSISFEIGVLPTRPTPGVFGAVLYARPFRVFKITEKGKNALEPTFGRGSEYKSSYFSNQEDAKVVIKLIISPNKQRNTKLIDIVDAERYLSEGYIQLKVFNEVYGTYDNRYDVPLSPGFPFLQFAALLNTLPPKGDQGLDFKIVKTIGEYMFNMYLRGRSPYMLPADISRRVSKPSILSTKQPSIIESQKEEFIKLFNKEYKNIMSAYRLGMLVMEYAGNPIYRLFINGPYGIDTNPPKDLKVAKKVILPIIFQILHVRAVMNKLGYIHMDIKTDNMVVISLRDSSLNNMYHTLTDKGDIKAPLFSIELPNSTFAGIEEERIVVNPLKEFQDSGELDGEEALILKVIDFGSASDKKKMLLKNISALGDETPSSLDVYLRKSTAYAYAYRPPEAYKNRRLLHRVYHLSDAYASGILIFDVVTGANVQYLASAVSVKRDWKKSYRISSMKKNWTDISDETDRGYLLLGYFVKHFLFECLTEMQLEDKIEKEEELLRLRRLYKENSEKFFIIKDTNYYEKIDWNDGGVISESQYERLIKDLKSDAWKSILRAYDRAPNEKNRKTFEYIVNSAHDYALKARNRIKTILGEEGIYMLLKVLTFDYEARPWAKEVLVEQLQQRGIFHYMVEKEEKYYERLKMLGSVKGVSRYNLGLYNVSLDIARPYSQRKFSNDDEEMRFN